MVESETVFHNNGMGKSRRISIEVAHAETQARQAFLEEFIPELHTMFRKRGVNNVLIDVIGSVAAGCANEESDIDLLIRQEGVEDLVPVTKAGIYIRAQDLKGRTLPYEIDWWFSHPFIYPQSKSSLTPEEIQT